MQRVLQAFPMAEFIDMLGAARFRADQHAQSG
jgi:hypothetical protein